MSGWISVNDRLPENAGQGVLVCIKNMFEQTHITIAFLGYEGIEWFCGDNEYDLKIWTVTHWMPLPEQPKEHTKEIKVNINIEVSCNNEELLYKKRVSVKPYEKHYEEKGEKPYVKYGCPICKACGVFFSLSGNEESCPCCGINLLWEKGDEKNE